MIRKILFFASTALFLVGCNSTPDKSQATDTVDEIGINGESEIAELDFTSDDDLQYFFDAEINEQQVLIKAEVIKNLADDNEGSRHQKFLVRLASGQTLLISHNIDLADRINDLEEGDEVVVFGQYEWNDRGGVIHWTHHDPDGYHVGGWIEHENRRYE